MSGAGSLEAFLSDPGAWADPARVAPLVAPGLRPQTAVRLIAGARTGARASRLLAESLGSGDVRALPAADRTLLLLAPGDLDRLGAAAGAVWHGRRVRALMRGADIAALAARFGPSAREAALRHDPPLAVAADGDLAELVATDGALCVASWVTSLPAWARARLALVREWPAVPDGAGRELRAGLIRRLADELAA